MLALALFACTGGSDDGSADSGHHHHGGDTATWDTTTSADTDGGLFHVTYTTDPDPIVESEEFAITFEVYDPADVSTMLTDATLSADGWMPAHGHGMNVTPVASQNKDGSWTVAPFQFHMTGHWEIPVEVTRGGDTDTLTFHVDCCG